MGEYEVDYSPKKPYAAFISPEKSRRLAPAVSPPLISARGADSPRRDLSEEARRAYIKLQAQSQRVVRFAKQSGRAKDLHIFREGRNVVPLLHTQEQYRGEPKRDAEFVKAMNREHEIYVENERRVEELETEVNRCFLRHNYQFNAKRTLGKRVSGAGLLSP